MGTGYHDLVVMERWNRRHCRPPHKPCKCIVCKTFSEDVGWNGRCLNCSMNKVKTVVRELKEGKGYYHNKWRQGLKKFISGK